MVEKGVLPPVAPLLECGNPCKGYLTQEGLASQDEGEECHLRAQQMLGRGQEHVQLGRGHGNSNSGS